eukprot:scaffold3051_cov167-Ochromonas_danica.AAC.35
MEDSTGPTASFRFMRSERQFHSSCDKSGGNERVGGMNVLINAFPPALAISEVIMSTEKYPDSEYYGGTRAIPAVEVTSPHPAPVSSPTPVQGQIIYISNGPATANPIVGPGYRPNERFDAENVARPVRPINRWADNICDWPKNLYPSCYCACCVCWGLYIQAQIAKRSLYVVARHLYGYSKVLDGDGDPFRPDGYAHQV